MIPTLLWRCPLCATNDALIHIDRRFRADIVRCRHCQAAWRMRRVPGDNFYLKLTAGRDGVPPDTGDERSITAWYDAMKATVRLEPVHDPVVALEPGELLYLASGPAELIAEETDPLFFSVQPDLEATRLDKREVGGKTASRGRLFLSQRRLIWQGEGRTIPWPLTRLNSAYAFVDDGLMLMVGMRLYTVRFQEESLLKWVTYVALVAPQVEAETGQHISMSHY
jgi:hypothetical protein